MTTHGWCTVSVVVLTTMMLLLLMSLPRVDTRCMKTTDGKSYTLSIGLLTASVSNLTIQRTIQENILRTGQLKDCFSPPHYLTLPVRETLKIPKQGWNAIQKGIENSLMNQGAEPDEVPNVIIGPFYTNLAMILERLNIPYLVTDYKGFDWIDMSRVQDRTPWRTLVEIRPPAQEQNLAVVDLFRSESWESAVMVMPENAADNQECQDLASQMLGAGISLVPYTVHPGESIAREMVLQVLRNAQLFRQWNIIVCSPRDVTDHLIELVLDVARMFDLTLNEKQVFVLVDPSSALKPMANAQEMYNLGLFSARCRLLAFRYVEPLKEKDTDRAAAIDAAMVTTMALNNYIQHQKERNDVFSADRFLREFKNVRLPHGHTGRLQFNATGQRVNYTLHLYNHGGPDMYRKIAEWSPSGDSPGARLNLTGYDEEEHKTTQYGIFPQIVKIVVVVEQPFVMYRKRRGQTPSRDNQYEGFTIDLINRLAQDLKFNYQIDVSPHNAYGGPRDGGQWDGMVGEILNGNATLAAGAISITSAREKVIDFSLGVLSTGVNILIRKPQESRTIFQFLMPFSLELWMAILGGSALVSIVFFAMDYHSHTDRRFTMKETIWFAIGTIMKRGTDFAPVPISQRILTAGFTFFVLITVSTYTANMAAFLTTKNLGKAIDSFEALAADNSMGCGTVENSATMNFLKKGTKPVFRALWKKIRGSRGLVPNATAGRERVIRESGYAFIFDYLINAYSEMRYCETKAAASPILIQEHGLGMAEGAPFKTSINIALLRLKEEGFLQGLKKKWWDDKRTCDDESKTRSSQQEFGLEHMAGVFIVGLLGLGAALALFVFKKLYFTAKVAHARHRQRTPSNGDRSSEQHLSATPPSVREKERLCQNNTSFV